MDSNSMKYLKSYKVFESVSDVRNEIEDILTEIYHLGFEVGIYSTKHSHFDEIKVFIEKGDEESFSNNKYTPTSEFIDCLQHLISYADEQGFIIVISTFNNSNLLKNYFKSEEVEQIVNNQVDYIKIVLRK